MTRTVTFGELADDSNRLANALRGLGVVPGDRVGIVLPAAARDGRRARRARRSSAPIAVPLSILFGPDALDMRLRDADVRVVLGEGEPLERIAALGLDVPLIDVDRDLERLLGDASPSFEPAATTPDTPALLVYTSGTTGPPKGALHGHRVLAGPPAGVRALARLLPAAGDVIWTPADWAWIGGLYDVLMPALRHGRPVVAYRGGKFDPERAFDLIGRLGVRNVFMPATALRLMRSHDPGTPVSAPDGRERRRDGRGRDRRLVPRAARRPAERVLRADRGEPAHRQLLRLGGATRLDGAPVSRSRGAHLRRRGLRAGRRRSGRVPRLLAERGGDRGEGPRRLAAHR